MRGSRAEKHRFTAKSTFSYDHIDAGRMSVFVDVFSLLKAYAIWIHLLKLIYFTAFFIMLNKTMDMLNPSICQTFCVLRY